MAAPIPHCPPADFAVPVNAQALRLPLDYPDAARDSFEDLLDILKLLPYLGGVHDGGVVVQSCEALCLVAEDVDDVVAQVTGDGGRAEGGNCRGGRRPG